MVTNYSGDFLDRTGKIHSDFHSKSARKNIPQMLLDLIDARNSIMTGPALDALGHKECRSLASRAATIYNTICRKMQYSKHADEFRACLIRYSLPESLELH